MKKYQILKLSALAGMVFFSASCTDYVTVLPTDKITEEEFWEDRNDLDGVRYGAYKQLGACLDNFVMWGDIRSDNYVINPTYSSSQSNTTIYKKIKEAQLDSSMTQYDWGNVYKGINYCSKVLCNGQKVLDNDPQFTSDEWRQMRAEVTALRAYYYFQLLRAFKDIPYTEEVISTDAEVKTFAATDQRVVLDTLIKAVRSVSGQARNRYADKADTRGLMTNTAVDALLAEMYLFRSALREGYGCRRDSIVSDCDSVIFFAQRSIDELKYQNDLNNQSYGSATSKKDDYGSGVTNALLIKNENMKASFESSTSVDIDVNSYDAIFNNQNSDESIFEIQFSEKDSRSNSVVSTYWGSSEQASFTVSETAMGQAYGSNEDRKIRDTRYWCNCQNTFSGETNQRAGYNMVKWERCKFLSNDQKAAKVKANGDKYRNWICYRLTDVMLMMAEAYAAKSFGEEAANLNKCKSILDAIHKRSDIEEKTITTGDLKRANYLKLVMNERQIELMGEGKRWYDLVRYAERIGGGVLPDVRNPHVMDGADGVKQMVTTFLANSVNSNMVSTMKNRIKNRYGLYCPIYYQELRANKGILKQNPVWDREKGKNDNIVEE